MVITAWIVFIGIVAMLFAHIVLLIANKKYRKKMSIIWGIL